MHSPPPIAAFADTAKKAPFQQPAASTKTRPRTPPPQSSMPASELDGQRERSVAMVNDGLEVGNPSCGKGRLHTQAYTPHEGCKLLTHPLLLPFLLSP
jgi:hypothetical protein